MITKAAARQYEKDLKELLMAWIAKGKISQASEKSKTRWSVLLRGTRSRAIVV